MTIEGASAAAGHDKNGNLLGFATTDEIGSVMDMTKDETRKLLTETEGGGGPTKARKKNGEARLNSAGQHRAGRREGMSQNQRQRLKKLARRGRDG